MRIIVNKVIVSSKLGRELVVAGIQHNGMSIFRNELEILLVDENQAPQAQAVVDAHDGVDTVGQRFEAAEGQVRAIPGWATWSEAEALDWWTTNLSDAQVDAVANLADAKVILKRQNTAIRAMARMLIAMRDRLWPGLADE